MKDISRFTDEFKKKYKRLVVLVDNAGVITVDEEKLWMAWS